MDTIHESLEQKLDKENFNLKMRVYHLEARMAKLRRADGAFDGETSSDEESEGDDYEDLQLELKHLKQVVARQEADIEGKRTLLIKARNAIEGLREDLGVAKGAKESATVAAEADASAEAENAAAQSELKAFAVRGCHAKEMAKATSKFAQKHKEMCEEARVARVRHDEEVRMLHDDNERLASTADAADATTLGLKAELATAHEAAEASKMHEAAASQQERDGRIHLHAAMDIKDAEADLAQRQQAAAHEVQLKKLQVRLDDKDNEHSRLAEEFVSKRSRCEQLESELASARAQALVDANKAQGLREQLEVTVAAHIASEKASGELEQKMKRLLEQQQVAMKKIVSGLKDQKQQQQRTKDQLREVEAELSAALGTVNKQQIEMCASMRKALAAMHAELAGNKAVHAEEMAQLKVELVALRGLRQHSATADDGVGGAGAPRVASKARKVCELKTRKARKARKTRAPTATTSSGSSRKSAPVSRRHATVRPHVPAKALQRAASSAARASGSARSSQQSSNRGQASLEKFYARMNAAPRGPPPFSRSR